MPSCTTWSEGCLDDVCTFLGVSSVCCAGRMYIVYVRRTQIFFANGFDSLLLSPKLAGKTRKDPRVGGSSAIAKQKKRWLKHLPLSHFFFLMFSAGSVVACLVPDTHTPTPTHTDTEIRQRNTEALSLSLVGEKNAACLGV